MAALTTRHLVLAGSTFVALATIVTSSVSLYSLAVLCGIPEPLSAALPIALDAGAAVTALVWITEKGELRKWGRAVTIAALVASVAGNAIQHAITSGLLRVELPLVLIVGASIPAMLWATIHITALMARTPTVEVRAARKPRQSGRPAPTVADRVAETTPAAAQSERKPAVKPDGETATEWARREWPCTAKEIQLGTGVAKGSSYRIYNALLAEMEAS
ncbi:MAG: hypothetical protein JWO67_7396 [Streptosporangiaceae bacterium]|nr:hypothetical protein [Streptosporangiaceae bacterium]